MRAAPAPPVLAAMPTPLGQRRFNASCCRDLQPKSYQIVLGLVRQVPMNAYPTRWLERNLMAGLRCSFAQSIPAKGLVLASRSLQRIAASLTRRVGPPRAGHFGSDALTPVSVARLRRI